MTTAEHRCARCQRKRLPGEAGWRHEPEADYCPQCLDAMLRFPQCLDALRPKGEERDASG
jgi:hypothetical protein